ncbi:MAG TPA: DUF922 domain-containing protein [Chitinophagaceae bacterium]|nr:DUF922 domain-containing protein [Chitinophagaceae bacterium]
MIKIFFLLAHVYSLVLFSQKENSFINWSEHDKLTWDDFKATPQKSGDIAALTATHLGFSYKIVNGKISYSIECRFEKNRSWGMVKTSRILDHEQGHFDIAEIYSRKLFKALSEYRFNRNSFQGDLDSLYKNIVAEKDQYQQLYDLETDHSRNKHKQEDWRKKINDSLHAYNPWAGYYK